MTPPFDRIVDLRVSSEISPRDPMFAARMPRHYFYVGRSALLILFNLLNIRASYAGGDAAVERILDYGCGHGRVARWLRAGFPKAEIHVADFDRNAVEWCVEKFDCRDAGASGIENYFDLIWLGSVFTHLPADAAQHLLGAVLAGLRPNGVLAFTTQGRCAFERIRRFEWETDRRDWMHYFLDREKCAALVDGYRRTGYGYVDYPGRSGYGCCIAPPAWYAERVLAGTGHIQILLQEKAWDDHQDVSAFLRADLLDAAKGPLWSSTASTE